MYFNQNTVSLQLKVFLTGFGRQQKGNIIILRHEIFDQARVFFSVVLVWGFFFCELAS